MGKALEAGSRTEREAQACGEQSQGCSVPLPLRILFLNHPSFRHLLFPLLPLPKWRPSVSLSMEIHQEVEKTGAWAPPHTYQIRLCRGEVPAAVTSCAGGTVDHQPRNVKISSYGCFCVYTPSPEIHCPCRWLEGWSCFPPTDCTSHPCPTGCLLACLYPSHLCSLTCHPPLQ